MAVWALHAPAQYKIIHNLYDLCFLYRFVIECLGVKLLIYVLMMTCEGDPGGYVDMRRGVRAAFGASAPEGSPEATLLLILYYHKKCCKSQNNGCKNVSWED